MSHVAPAKENVFMTVITCVMSHKAYAGEFGWFPEERVEEILIIVSSLHTDPPECNSV